MATIQTNKIDRLMRAAASLLGIPTDEISSGTKSGNALAFRRACVAFLMSQLGVGRTDIELAMNKSPTWVDQSLNAVQERVSGSAPFELTIAAMLAELRLGSPVTARFRSIRSLIARQGGPASTDALNQCAALLTLADIISAGEEVVE